MSSIITPTPGRVVWYYPTAQDGIAQLNGQPLAAIVAGIHSDRLINLAVFDSYGNTQQRSSVQLVQPGEAVPTHAHAAWMPYQVNAAGIKPAPQVETDDAAPSSSEPVQALPEVGLVNEQITDSVTQ